MSAGLYTDPCWQQSSAESEGYEARSDPAELFFKQKRTRTFLIRVLRNNNLCRHFQALTNEAVRCDSGHTGAFFRKPLRMPYARSTLPERMHLVQTCIFLLPPAVFTAILWTFACQTLLDLLCEWLTWFPKKAPLPQIDFQRKRLCRRYRTWPF